jgi:hypothetical protein
VVEIGSRLNLAHNPRFSQSEYIDLDGPQNRMIIPIEALAGPSKLISRRVATTIRPSRRLQSTYPASPSPKIHAAPFHLDPAEAAHKLHMNALIASAKGSNLFLAGLLKIFGPSISGIARELGLGGDVVMRDMKAIYWPVWRVDALLEGEVAGKGTERSDGQAFFGAQEAYIPGMSCEGMEMNADDKAIRSLRFHTSLLPSRHYRKIYQNMTPRNIWSS